MGQSQTLDRCLAPYSIICGEVFFSLWQPLLDWLFILGFRLPPVHGCNHWFCTSELMVMCGFPLREYSQQGGDPGRATIITTTKNTAGYSLVSLGNLCLQIKWSNWWQVITLCQSGRIQFMYWIRQDTYRRAACRLYSTVGCFKNLQDAMIYQLNTTYARRCLQNCIPDTYIKTIFFWSLPSTISSKVSRKW